MSDRSLLLLLALVAGAGTLEAQDVERLEARERRLLDRLAQVTDSAAALSRSAFDRQERVVVSAGGFNVAYPAWAAAEGRSRLAAVVSTRRARYGVALDSLLTDTLVIWIYADGRAGGRRPARAAWRLGAIRESADVDLAGDLASDWVSGLPAHALDRWARALLDPDLTTWLGPTVTGQALPDLLDGSVRDLLPSRSGPARRCLSGDIAGCRRGLDLGGEGDELARWFDLADIPALFSRSEWIEERTPGRAACLAGRDLETCRRAMRAGGITTPRPTTHRVHESVYAFALATGGEGALLRLHRAAGRPVPDQLAAAAEVPIDSLIAAWQRALVAPSETTSAGLGSIVVLAIVWMVGLTLFFGWRFRWRHV